MADSDLLSSAGSPALTGSGAITLSAKKKPQRIVRLKEAAERRLRSSILTIVVYKRVNALCKPNDMPHTQR